MTHARGDGQLVCGLFNAPEGAPTVRVAGQPLFIVGNGIAETSRSNAFVVRENGNAELAETLRVQGSAATIVQGAIKARGGVLVPEQGDLSMGAFRAGPRPEL